MWTKREILLFFAGAEAFHTLSHLMLPMMVHFPVYILGIEYTSLLNILTILINLAITIALIWWADKSK
jgi:hypothetical protein